MLQFQRHSIFYFTQERSEQQERQKASEDELAAQVARLRAQVMALEIERGSNATVISIISFLNSRF
jgi:hypothetical protein